MTGGWAEAMAVYADRRVLAMAFLGFSSGVPFGVLAEPLSAWLAESGVSLTGIGLFALVSLPYSLKFVFAPFIDRLPLPGLTRRFGRRRGWALAGQTVLLLAIGGMGLTDPGYGIAMTAAFAVAVAFAAACQDVVLDAYRVEILDERKLAAGAATVVFGWRIGQFAAGAGGLVLADILPWTTVFLGLAAPRRCRRPAGGSRQPGAGATGTRRGAGCSASGGSVPGEQAASAPGPRRGPCLASCGSHLPADRVREPPWLDRDRALYHAL